MSVCSSIFAKNGGLAQGMYLHNKESMIGMNMCVEYEYIA